MQVRAVAVLVLLCLGAALAAPQPQPHDIIPFIADGFETALLAGMSWVTDIKFAQPEGRNLTSDNFTLFVHGNGAIRTIKHFDDHQYLVSGPPERFFHVNYIDLHMVSIGRDVWAFGPIQGYPEDGPSRFPITPNGFGIDIVVQTTKQSWSNHYDTFSRLGFEGAFFSMAPYAYKEEIYSYFVGFWPEWVREEYHNESFPVPLQLNFGVVRAKYNMSIVNETGYNQPHWIHNRTTDFVSFNNNTRFIPYTAAHKPIVLFAYGLPSPTNATTTVVVLPGTRDVVSVRGHHDGSPLEKTHFHWNATRGGGLGATYITSAIYVEEHHLVVLGLAESGEGTGDIVFLHAGDLTERGKLRLPDNYTDPKAIVDGYDGFIYVGGNSANHILKINVTTMQIVGYQRVPFYLDRIWAGQATWTHIYFVTNEQHSKVFRMSKHEFCETPCPLFGWCSHGTRENPDKKGHCVCGQLPGVGTNLQLSNNKCVVPDAHGSSGGASKAGEAVLGVFFAIAFVAAAAGWYIVWKNKRQGYQAV